MSFKAGLRHEVATRFAGTNSICSHFDVSELEVNNETPTVFTKCIECTPKNCRSSDRAPYHYASVSCSQVLYPTIESIRTGATVRPIHNFIPSATSSWRFFGQSGRNATFDYVVVGGGTAGLAIASRLAENSNLTVAIIEAGNFYELVNGNISQVPELDVNYDSTTVSSQWANPAVDWGFLSTPQQAVGNSTLHYSRGKTLGGCSAFNSMICNRGTKQTYDQWANLTGDDIWNWNNLLPYFSKSIKYSGNGPLRATNATVPLPEPEAFTNGGPLHLSFPNYALPISSWIEKTMRALGIQETPSLIGGQLIGSQYVPNTIDPKQGTRDSSQTSFVNAAIAEGRTNLKVYLNTMAVKIQFQQNSTTPRATGVEVSWNPRAPNSVLTATREVIVSAGTVQSPQLLMVSGIGPAAPLRQHNIPIISNLPGVGQNLWEHFLVVVSSPTIITNGYDQVIADPAFAEKAREQFYTNQTGPLTSGNTDYLGWEKIAQPFRSALGANTTARLDAMFPPDWPEVELETSSGDLTMSGDPRSYATLIGGLVAPLSRGSVSINSTNMNDPPILDLGLLTDPGDQAVAVQTVKRLRQILNQTVLQRNLDGPEILPGPNVGSDEEILEYIKKNPAVNWHAACTCKMGRDEDEMAVLDSRARVRGVTGLRVVDASSFPTLPPGHPMSSVYALAERIAKDILDGVVV